MQKEDNNLIKYIEKYILNASRDIKQLLQDKLVNEEFLLSLREMLKENIPISFVIMTYNEERVIERCLNSIYELANEIIIFDTGSTDQTLEILRDKFPKVKVYQSYLNDDFSNIRNQLNDYATNNWIFQIDADEYIGREQLFKIQAYIALLENLNVEPKVISPVLINHDRSKILNTRRIYKKSTELKYVGRVHEELRYKGTATFSFLIVEINYFHDGYRKNIIKSKDKYTRNIKLLEKTIVDEDDNPRWYYFLAREKKLANHRPEEIIPIIKKGLEYTIPLKKEYIIGLIDQLIELAPEEYALLPKYIEYLKKEFAECMDVYYYESFLFHFYEQVRIIKETNNCIDLVIGLEEPISFIDDEGCHLFWFII